MASFPFLGDIYLNRSIYSMVELKWI